VTGIDEEAEESYVNWALASNLRVSPVYWRYGARKPFIAFRGIPARELRAIKLPLISLAGGEPTWVILHENIIFCELN